MILAELLFRQAHSFLGERKSLLVATLGIQLYEAIVSVIELRGLAAEVKL